MTTSPPVFPMLVAEWEKNAREVLRVELDCFNGTLIINIRNWFKINNELKPTKTGIAVSTRHLPRLAEAITTALATARHFDIVEPNPDERQPP